jgi:hypothetical protein
MSRRLTLNTAKAKIARILGVATSDTRVKDYLNEAEERLLNRMLDPVGAWMRYRVCVGTSACLVWPRQIRTIKAYWLCNTPGKVVSDWFETVGWDEGGYGMRDADSHDGKTMIDRGLVCSFDNVIATTAEPRKIQAVAADASDNGKTIHLRYIDSNGNRKYTSQSGSVQEGETLTLSTSGVLTTSNLATNGLYHVVKQSTNYPVRLYSYDVNSATQSSLLAVYEPSETVPQYRSSLIPGLTEVAACPDASDDCTVNKQVTVLARVQHVPVVNDNDPLVLTNLGALADMVQSILMRERHLHREAAELEAHAIAELEGELSAHLGDGVLVNPRFPDVESWGGGAIMNYV